MDIPTSLVFKESRPVVSVERITTGQRVHLADPLQGNGSADLTTGCHVFSPDGFATALDWLVEDARDCPVLIPDAISKLEMQGRGHAAALRWALRLGADRLLLVCARASQLFWVIESFGLDVETGPVAHLEEPIDEMAAGRFAASLAKMVHSGG